MIKSKKIAPGIYDVTVNGRLFEVEQVTDGTWQLVEIVGSNRDYWNHFETKKSAMDAIKSEVLG